MNKKLKEIIIPCGRAFLFILVGIGTIMMVAHMTTSLRKKKEDTLYTKFQSFEYIIIDGISIKTSEIQSFENKSGTYYKNYTFILEDGTEIATDSYILTNRRDLNDN